MHKKNTDKSTASSTDGKNKYDSSDYDKYYFDHCCGVPYTRENLFPVFSNIAQKIVDEIKPKKVLDAGCGKGFLVEALRDKGIEAYGIETSTYAFDEIQDDMKKYCKIQSVTTPLTEKYDLIVCIEVLEHLKKEEAERAIENFCHATDDIVFSSTPEDFREPTHHNVKPLDYWASIFAKYSFFHDLEFDATFINNHAIRFKKNKEPISRIIKIFERQIWEQKKELLMLREELNKHGQTNRTVERMVSEKKKEMEGLFYNDPMSLLLYLYNIRSDLQQVFPETREGSYQRLLEWALNVSTGKYVDPYRKNFEPYSQWYKEEIKKINDAKNIQNRINPLEKKISDLESEKNLLNNSLQQQSHDLAKQKDSYETIKKLSDSLVEKMQKDEKKFSDLTKAIKEKDASLEDLTKAIKEKDASLEDLTKAIKEKDKANHEIQTKLRSLDQQMDFLTKISKEKDGRIHNLEAYSNQVLEELTRSKSLLSEIQNSYGYNLLLSLQQRLDKSLPDGSRRGEFKKILIASLRTIKKDGTKKYLSAVREKIELGEFKIIPNPNPNTTQLMVGTIARTISPTPIQQVESHSGLKFGINFSGYFTGEFGIGESARSIARGLQYSGIPFVLNNLEVTGQRSNDSTFTDFSGEYPYKINIVHANAIDTPGFVASHGLGFFNNRFNIGVWFWELSNFPEIWAEHAKYFDEIWVYTNFIASSLTKTINKPIVRITPAIYLDEKKIVRDKRKFGIRDEDYAFLYIFDFQSILERKNPYAAIRAFKKAFKKNDNAVLVLKYMNTRYFGDEEKRLLKECDGINVKIINTQIDKMELQSLMKSCDCYVSLHRSEGFGYNMAESMFLGKPVIATPYGGNIDFMNSRNSFLVKYKLVELDQDYGVYKKGNIWADPEIDDAAFLMRYVYENPEFAEEVGKKGSEFIKTCFNPKVTGNEILSRLQHLK